MLIIGGVVVFLHLGHPVALDGVDPAVPVHPDDDAHVVGNPVALFFFLFLFVRLLVEEDQVARLGLVFPVSLGLLVFTRRHVQPALRQLVKPTLLVRGARHRPFRHIRIVQAERRVHGAPFLVGQASLRAVARPALHLAVLADDEVLLALLIAQLRLGDGQEVLRPLARQLDVLEHVIPVVPALGLVHGAGKLEAALRRLAELVLQRHLQRDGARFFQNDGRDGHGVAVFIAFINNRAVLRRGDLGRGLLGVLVPAAAEREAHRLPAERRAGLARHGHRQLRRVDD